MAINTAPSRLHYFNSVPTGPVNLDINLGLDESCRLSLAGFPELQTSTSATALLCFIV